MNLRIGYWRAGKTRKAIDAPLEEPRESQMLAWVEHHFDDECEPIQIVGLDHVVDDDGNVTLNIGYWPAGEETGWVVLASLDQDWLNGQMKRERENYRSAEEVAESIYGHCDTCGAPCDTNGCTADPRHPVALSHDDQQPRMNRSSS